MPVTVQSIHAAAAVLADQGQDILDGMHLVEVVVDGKGPTHSALTVGRGSVDWQWFTAQGVPCRWPRYVPNDQWFPSGSRIWKSRDP